MKKEVSNQSLNIQSANTVFERFGRKRKLFATPESNYFYSKIDQLLRYFVGVYNNHSNSSRDRYII